MVGTIIHVIYGSNPGPKTVSKTRRSSSIASCGQQFQVRENKMDTDTDSTPQNAYKPFGSVLPNRETEVVASIPVAPMSIVTPEAIEVEHDNVVTETRDIAVFTPTSGLPRE